MTTSSDAGQARDPSRDPSPDPAREPLGIVELAGVCDRLADRNHELFGVLGRWVADEPDPARQRWFATAAHRHAWHADLWAARAPALRDWSLEPATVAARGRIGAPADSAARGEWHHRVVAGLVTELDGLAAVVDAELDPSTARTIALVRADLARLGQ